MAIENPAAIFSEAGLKIFVEAILKAKSEADLIGTVIPGGSNSDGGNNGGDRSNDEVGALIEEYKEYKKGNPDMEEITALVTHFLYNNGEPMTNTEIKDWLSKNGYDYTLRGMGPLMRGIAKRNPSIKKISKNTYDLEVESNE